MTIHRPTWEREMTIKAWTEGRDRSLFYITAPPKDEGNGTLLKEGEMWTYNPKINRVVKIPPSMMSQSWMGSDFSNNDLAKSDDVIEHYTHSIESTETQNGLTVYLVKSLPKPQAPVVWGMQQHRIREDYLVLSQEFFDQDQKSVKKLTTQDIQTVDGKLYPMVWTIRQSENPEKYTRLEHQELEFQDDLPDRFFTLQSLKNPRR
jgi:outer membrane lipoprotein-sorting protein